MDIEKEYAELLEVDRIRTEAHERFCNIRDCLETHLAQRIEEILASFHCAELLVECQVVWLGTVDSVYVNARTLTPGSSDESLHCGIQHRELRHVAEVLKQELPAFVKVELIYKTLPNKC